MACHGTGGAGLVFRAPTLHRDTGHRRHHRADAWAHPGTTGLARLKTPEATWRPCRGTCCGAAMFVRRFPERGIQWDDRDTRTSWDIHIKSHQRTGILI